MVKALGAKDYHRVGVGGDHPPGRMDAAAYVFKSFATSEAKELPFLLDAAEAVEALVEQGLLEGQQKYHSRA